ncbi:MAG TPA: PilZ domain-containing protein [Anaeromyxobacter sp.]|nr:PilZ domain-containing protein [Anaeromyxobacter sp.]
MDAGAGGVPRAAETKSAQEDAMEQWPRQRRFTRIPFHVPAHIEFRGGKLPCELVNVSLKGALVELAQGPVPSAGSTCAVTIDLDPGSGARIRMDGDVAHQNGRQVGIRCDELDLESVQHLRRILEFNVGDEALVLRELGELVAERDFEREKEN